MKIDNIKIKISIFSLIAFQLGISMFPMDGLSASKLLLTSLLWISFIAATSEFFYQISSLKKKISFVPRVLLMALILYNVLGVIMSFYQKSDSVTTILGNDYASLAILIPVVFIFSLKLKNLKIINSVFLKMLQIGLILTPLTIILPINSLPFSISKIIIFFLSPVIFLINSLKFLGKKDKILVLIAFITILVISYFSGGRTMILRGVLLIAAVFALYFYDKFNLKLFLIVSFLLLIIPFVLIKDSINSGESAFETYLSKSGDDELNVDTRTFLYLELYEDLSINNKLIFGKGAVGRYFSYYFSKNDGDGANRLVSEVGILGILLKGGFIAVFLNLIVFFICVFLAFFRSRNSYVKGAGYFLLVHVILLFIENLIVYSIYNFLVWITVGICLSNKVRHLNNKHIRYYLFNNQ